ncbi:MAG: DUF192 domain-containing protein [Candidatus Brocadiales bacterium]
MTNNSYKLLAAVIIAGLIAYSYVVSRDHLPKMTVGGKEIYVELAVDPDVRGRGLMFRTRLEEDHGMLFVFPVEDRHAFWMKDTEIPLSIAFIKNGVVTQLEDMEPHSLERHASTEEVKYALEMNRGWFKRNDVHVGGLVIIPPITRTGAD